MRRLHTTGILLAALAWLAPAQGREWSDSSGKFKVEASLVTVKDGKVYLEKTDGKVTTVELGKLSQADLDYLQSLPEYKEYFAAHPVGGKQGTASGPAMAVIRVDDESKVGEVRRFSDLGWGVKSLAFSANGGLLAAGKMDNALMVFDVNKSTRTAFYEKLEGLGQVTALAFTPDGKKLLAGGYTGRIQVWDVGPGGVLTEANRFVGHAGEIHCIRVGSDGTTVLSGGGEKKARSWDLASGRERFAIEGFQGDVKDVFISRTGKQGLACDGELLALIDMKEGKVLQTMKLAGHTAQAVAIAPNGSRVVVQDMYALRVWEVRTGKETRPLQDKEIQWSARFLPNGKYLISGGRAKVNLWEVDTQRKIYEFDTAGTYYVQTLACSPDNRHFAAMPGSAGQALQVFRLPADVAKE